MANINPQRPILGFISGLIEICELSARSAVTIKLLKYKRPTTVICNVVQRGSTSTFDHIERMKCEPLL